MNIGALWNHLTLNVILVLISCENRWFLVVGTTSIFASFLTIENIRLDVMATATILLEVVSIFPNNSLTTIPSSIIKGSRPTDMALLISAIDATASTSRRGFRLKSTIRSVFKTAL